MVTFTNKFNRRKYFNNVLSFCFLELNDMQKYFLSPFVDITKAVFSIGSNSKILGNDIDELLGTLKAYTLEYWE